jgi:AraC-like DNA-binding protein
MHREISTPCDSAELPRLLLGIAQIGDLDLLDYLFTTAATLQDALRASSDFNHLAGRNTEIEVESGTDGTTSYKFRLIEPSGRGRELMLQLTVAMPPVVSWPEHFRLVLDGAVTQGPMLLKDMAARLGVSSRTLQRQLAEQDTTWRAELDAARRRIATRAGPVSAAELADRVGYADPRSARRAAARWRSRSPGVRPLCDGGGEGCLTTGAEPHRPVS